MDDLDNAYAQRHQSENDDDSDTDDENEIITTNNSRNVVMGNTQNAQEIAEIFQRNIKEAKVHITTLQVRRTVRDKIFPFMKFTTEDLLRDIKLREHNNIIHLLLQDLNRLNDDDKTRAKFWLAYKSEVKNVLTTRKTEVCYQMKEVVVECKCQCITNVSQKIFTNLQFYI